ncbi:DNA-binding protein (plasmid) [Clostridium botulinum]|uniref:HU family DNA-binding protein n=1 Tax=Clostridium botulinum TaxID=1491 RepID=UPI00069C0A69|nr:HU family DNA-binding protein [Clostridium botulinum]KOA94884.1 DNA-binding protein [Clostridium botulinum]
MNKTELVNSMAERAGLSKKDAELALKAFIESVTGALKEGKKVQLIGFGTFETRERSERKGHNPRTKEEITIPASVVPAFKTSDKFKEIIKEQFNK